MSVLENHVDENGDKLEVVVTEAMIEKALMFFHGHSSEEWQRMPNLLLKSLLKEALS